MKIAFKKEMKLTEAKNLIKDIKSNGGQVIRSGNADSATLKDNRGRSVCLCFKSNLELKGLI